MLWAVAITFAVVVGLFLLYVPAGLVAMGLAALYWMLRTDRDLRGSAETVSRIGNIDN